MKNGILCHPSLKAKPPVQKAIPTDEARAAMVRDSIGRVTEGDYRQRVYDAALEHIGNAKAQLLRELGVRR